MGENQMLKVFVGVSPPQTPLIQTLSSHGRVVTMKVSCRKTHFCN